MDTTKAYMVSGEYLDDIHKEMRKSGMSFMSAHTIWTNPEIRIKKLDKTTYNPLGYGLGINRGDSLAWYDGILFYDYYYIGFGGYALMIPKDEYPKN